ncbi:hypothetical protein CPJ18_02045 [Agrobacterium rosae]|uniref:Uncharacterized protein n=1 Tax=Agrobacterium rosae TaxID=1972867 RepID=A0AAE5S279_9HYPH|nr:DUF3226 domain-containing protein [Agrobacterium rosae]POO54305.1 hypothetical protein CPJ18_02045 [Agrobacterium rosae]
MAVAGKFFTRSVGKSRLDVETVILVEGSDDGFFLDEVLTSIGALPENVGVCVAEGKDNFASLLQAMLKAPTFTNGKIRRYAVIRDVDDNLAKCKAECAKLFNGAGEPVPEPAAFASRNDGRHNGLFLMPSGAETGSLETLALGTLQDHPVLNAAHEYLVSSGEKGGSVDHLDKRRAQALLASISAPLCNGVGWATRRGLFDIGSPSLLELKNFLTTLQQV